MNIDLYKAIVPDTPPEILSWRLATGKNNRDEVWESVYHVVEEESQLQLDLENELEMWLITNWACALDGRVFRDTRLARNDQIEFDFRVPSICLYADWSPETYCHEVLIDPPDVVIEVFDSSAWCNQKVDFYRGLGVEEIWILDARTKICELTICKDKKCTSTISNQAQPIESPATGIQIICPQDLSNNNLFELSANSHPFRKPK